MTIKQATDKTDQHEEARKASETEVVQPSNTLLPPPITANTVESEDPISKEENERLKAENELLKQQLASMGASFAKSKEIKTVDEPADNALTLLFNPNEAGMVPSVEITVVKYIRAMQAKFGPTAEIEITASEPDGISFSQARERALTRAMVVRNVLLNNKLDPSHVSFNYDAEERFKSHNWVRLQVREAKP
jgi:hypothetical protein